MILISKHFPQEALSFFQVRFDNDWEDEQELIISKKNIKGGD